MTNTENIRLAFTAVRSNLLRAVLTLMIIAFGIMALVGILTAIDSITYSLSNKFSGMGANAFSIYPKGNALKKGGPRANDRRAGTSITYREAMEFKEKFDAPAKVTVFAAERNTTVKFDDKKTNPTVKVLGIDENYLAVQSYELELGRNLTETEVADGAPKAIIGQEIVNVLFQKKPDKAVGQTIDVNGIKYKVVGVLKSKGSSMNSNNDNVVMTTLNNLKRYYGFGEKNYNITVAVADATLLDDASSTATGAMRAARNLKLGDEDDFEVFKSDGLVAILKENTVKLRLAAITIGFITLLGAAIGLMNIMLVSVTERTREIGICKALGATRRNILIQFLTEAILICQVGGIVGIVLGILIGNIVTLIIGGAFLIPWLWMTLGIVVCTVVGLASGLYPAIKAASLDPIESLRYE